MTEQKLRQYFGSILAESLLNENSGTLKFPSRDSAHDFLTHNGYDKIHHAKGHSGIGYISNYAKKGSKNQKIVRLSSDGRHGDSHIISGNLE